MAGIKLPNGEIVFEFEDNSEIPIRLKSFNEERNNYEILCDSNIISRFSLWEILGNIPNLPMKAFEGKYEGAIALTEYLKTLADPIELMADPWDMWYNLSFLSTAPIRSRPERTYDPMREFNDPEGSDIPMLLMRLEATQKKKWEKLKHQLVEFGVSSGLFQDIKIKNFGRSYGNPFQIQFKVRGPTSNIIDVGYGVSQILPILVQVLYPNIIQDSRTLILPTYNLLQQPEVHMHPKAQAEFSSLLAKLANQGNQSFMVETHSDNMIDRARIDIMKGHINPEDVSLIYFEPIRNIVKVHNIGFDKMGNLLNVPKHYRDFFLLESDRLMGFED